MELWILDWFMINSDHSKDIVGFDDFDFSGDLDKRKLLQVTDNLDNEK